MTERGHISIHTENILPIIKKWLYSEKEIFLRELVANAADALTKLEKLSLIGEMAQDRPDPSIHIHLDKDKKTISITDTGIGMTADEIKKYINQVAFSGVKDFLAKYQDKGGDEQVIGHFGLGFYSAFMVADKVEIDTLSFREGSEAAYWSCDGSTEFELGPSDRKEIGTTITLHVNEDSKDMLDAYTLRDILNKYCAFIRFPIFLENDQVNEPRPLWSKNPSEVKDEEYLAFFERLFPMAPKPLFWIHLNVDYPFKLKGILFFPKLKHELDASQGEVKLYCSQVFVADNPKELVPEFLTLLKGAIDCPDLPLNVSRSYLQNDPQARKIREHITKKVADKLSGLAKTERETYEKYWEDIQPFVKFGMMRDQKFSERMQEHLLFKTASGTYITLDQYLEKYKDKTDGKIIYASDLALQSSKLALLREHEVEAIIAEGLIDQHFLPYLEMQTSRKYQFQRIDADILKVLRDHTQSTIVDPRDQKTREQKVSDLFAKFLDTKGVKVQVEGLKSEKLPAILTIDENARRMRDMAKMNPMFSSGLDLAKDLESTLIVNSNSAAVKRLLDMSDGLSIDDAALKTMVQQIYDLAYLQHNKFSPEAMQAFIERSASILSGFQR